MCDLRYNKALGAFEHATAYVKCDFARPKIQIQILQITMKHIVCYLACPLLNVHSVLDLN